MGETNGREMAFALPGGEAEVETSLGVFRLVKEHQPGLLFVIYRSSNTNCVTYFVDPAEPDSVQVRWHMYERAPDGSDRERLTMLERNTAYGLSQQPGADGAILLKISALKGRDILVRESKAYTEINGVPECELKVVYVMLTTNFLGIPRVDYAE